MEYLAQKEINIGGIKGLGILGLEGRDPGESGMIFNKFLSSLIGILTIIAFIWFTILLITAAYGIMSAGGDKGALESSRKRLTTGIIGLVVVIAAIFLVRLFGSLLGIQSILNPADLIDNVLRPGAP